MLPHRSLVITQDWKSSADTVNGNYGQAATIRLWRDKLDTPSAILLKHDNHSPDHLAFNPSGSLIASGSDWYNLLLWDTKTHERLIALDTAGISDLAFSPDGKMIATSHANTGGSTQNRIYLWGIPVPK